MVYILEKPLLSRHMVNNYKDNHSNTLLNITSESKIESLSDKAFRVLEEKIVTLELQPGTIVTELKLCNLLNIGRTPIREAIQKLSSSGLMVTLPRKGLFITELNPLEQKKVIETREVLERLIISSAVERFSDPHSHELIQCVKKLEHAEKEKDVLSYIRLEKKLHEIIGIIANNAYTSAALSPLQSLCRRFWFAYQTPYSLKQLFEFHSKLSHSILSKNQSHALHSVDMLIELLNQKLQISLSS